MLQRVHLAEVVATRDLAEPRDQRLGGVAGVGVLLRERRRLLDLVGRAPGCEVSLRQPLTHRQPRDEGLDVLQEVVLCARWQRRHALGLGLDVRGQHPLGHEHLGSGVPHEQRPQLRAQRQLGLPQQIAPGVGARVDVHVHRVAGLRAQEERRAARGERLAGALQRQAVGERAREQARHLAELAAAADGIGQRGDGRRLVLAGREAQIALQQAELRDQPVHVVQRRRHRGTRDVPHRRASEVPRVVPAEVLESPPGEDREQEIVVVDLVLGNRDVEQVLEDLHRREPLEQVEVVMIARVIDAAPGGGAERLERRLDAVLLRHRLGLGQDEGPHGRRVDVLVGHGHVLDHGQARVLAGQPRRDVPHRVQPRQRVERTAVMAGRQIRRAHHRQARGQEHVPDRGAGGEPVVGAGDDVLGRRLLDEAHERLDGLGIRDGSGHASSSGWYEELPLAPAGFYARTRRVYDPCTSLLIGGGHPWLAARRRPRRLPSS